MTEQPQDTLPLVAMTPEQQLQAMARYEVLQPVLRKNRISLFFSPLPDRL